MRPPSALRSVAALLIVVLAACGARPGDPPPGSGTGAEDPVTYLEPRGRRPGAPPRPWGPVLFLKSPAAPEYAVPGPTSELSRALAAEALRSAKSVAVPDPCLERAAAELAAHVRDDCRIWPRVLEEAALQNAGCTDGASYSILVCSDSDDDGPLLATVAKKLPALATEPVSRCGGARVPGAAGMHVGVALFTSRRVEIDPFPRRLEPGASAVLEGRGAAGFANLRLYLLDPGGEMRVLPVPTEDDGRFRIVVRAPARTGTAHLELMGDGSLGPSVLALFPVSIGEAPRAELILPTPQDESGIRTESDAEALAFSLLNADRARYSLPPFVPHDGLAQAARAHAREMRDSGYFGHVSRTTGGPGDRFRREGLHFSAYAENLGKATTLAGAQEGILGSPAHRSALLSPLYTHAGVGVAIGEEGGVRVYTVVQEFGRPQTDMSPEEFADAVAERFAAWRREAGIEPAVRDARLEGAARRLVPLAERGVSGKNALDGLLDQATRGLELQGYDFRALQGQSQIVGDPSEVKVPEKFDLPGRDWIGIGVEPRREEGITRRYAVLILVAER